MTEDIAFSVVLHYYAKKLAYSGHDGYFYYRNGSSSTIAVNGLEKIKKNVKDLKKSFSFVKAFLQEKEVFEKYEKKYQNLKDRYFRWWSYSVKKNTEEKSKEAQYVRKDFLAFFGKTEFETPKEEDDFFTDAYTTWNGQYEQLKLSILDAAIEYVSFDIFDTLILRPFLEPTDLYFFMEKEFKSLVPGNLSFHEVRADAERLCRKNIKIWAPSSQDVTLQEIYEQMRKRYQFSEDVCRRLMKKEEELEIKFCTERKAGKELYEIYLKLHCRHVRFGQKACCILETIGILIICSRQSLAANRFFCQKQRIFYLIRLEMLILVRQSVLLLIISIPSLILPPL